MTMVFGAHAGDPLAEAGPTLTISDAFGDLAMDMDDALIDLLTGFSEFSATSMMRSPAPSDAYMWSSGAETPLHSTAATMWFSSTATGSPMSQYLLCGGALSFQSGMASRRGELTFGSWPTHTWTLICRMHHRSLLVPAVALLLGWQPTLALIRLSVFFPHAS
jgi:hypothetical protein